MSFPDAPPSWPESRRRSEGVIPNVDGDRRRALVDRRDAVVDNSRAGAQIGKDICGGGMRDKDRGSRWV